MNENDWEVYRSQKVNSMMSVNIYKGGVMALSPGVVRAIGSDRAVFLYNKREMKIGIKGVTDKPGEFVMGTAPKVSPQTNGHQSIMHARGFLRSIGREGLIGKYEATIEGDMVIITLGK